MRFVDDAHDGLRGNRCARDRIDLVVGGLRAFLDGDDFRLDGQRLELADEVHVLVDLVTEPRRLAALEHFHADDPLLGRLVSIEQRDGVLEARARRRDGVADELPRVVIAAVDHGLVLVGLGHDDERIVLTLDAGRAIDRGAACGVARNVPHFTCYNRTDAALRARFETRGKLPITVLRVRADEVFLHCAKAFRRGRVWDPPSWGELADAPDGLDVLHRLMIPSPSGQQVPLTTLGRIVYTGTIGDITRINNERVVTVKASVDETKVPGAVARQQAEDLLKAFILPPGYRLKFTGEYRFERVPVGRARVDARLDRTEAERRFVHVRAGLEEVLDRFLSRRWLADDKVTLQELADEYGVSAERIRQIEKNAMKKLKADMLAA